MTSVAALQIHERARARSFARLRESCRRLVEYELAGARDTESLPYGWCIDQVRWRQMEDENAGPFLPNVRERLNASTKTVIAVVAEVTGISPARILSKTKQKPVVRARWLVMAALREFKQEPPHEIARILNMDHTTVAYGLGCLSRIIADDVEEAAAWDRLCMYLGRLS